MPEEMENKKSKIAVGLGMEYRLGPHRTMNISTHVSQDDSIEDIHKQADILAAVAGRQQAIAELDAYYEELRIETTRLNDARMALDRSHSLNRETKEKLKKEWDKKHNDDLATFEASWNASRKGPYKKQPQHDTHLKNIDNSYKKKLDDLELNYQAEVSNHKSNIGMLEARIEDTNRSVSKREAIVHGSKVPLKLVNEG